MGEGGLDQEPKKSLPSHVTRLEEYLIQGSTPDGSEEIADVITKYNENQTPELYEKLVKFASFPENLSPEQIEKLNHARQKPIEGGMIGLAIFDALAMGIDNVMGTVAQPSLIGSNRKTQLEWNILKKQGDKLQPLGSEIKISPRIANVLQVQGNKVSIRPPQTKSA